MHDHEKIARKNKAVLMLSGLTIMWGTTFAIVQGALADISPIYFAALRFGLAGLIYSAVSNASRDGIRILFRPSTDLEKRIRTLSLLLGSALALGYVFQFIGLETTTSSKSAFLTATTVMWTPLFAVIFLRARFGLWLSIAIILSISGIILLTDPFPVEEIVIGDIWSALCAVSFGIYILTLDRIMPVVMSHEGDEHKAVMMISGLQLAVGAAVILLFLPIESAPKMIFSGRSIFALLYTTFFATILSTYIQSRYQKEISPVLAVLIYTLEPVAALVIAYVFLGESLSMIEWIGAALILCGMLAGQKHR